MLLRTTSAKNNDILVALVKVNKLIKGLLYIKLSFINKQQKSAKSTGMLITLFKSYYFLLPNAMIVTINVAVPSVVAEIRDRTAQRAKIVVLSIKNHLNILVYGNARHTHICRAFRVRLILTQRKTKYEGKKHLSKNKVLFF